MEICSLSGGKDSVALCIKGKYNQAVFYDTEMEFQAIYNVIEQINHLIIMFLSTVVLRVKTKAKKVMDGAVEFAGGEQQRNSKN